MVTCVCCGELLEGKAVEPERWQDRHCFVCQTLIGQADVALAVIRLRKERDAARERARVAEEQLKVANEAVAELQAFVLRRAG